MQPKPKKLFILIYVMLTFIALCITDVQVTSAEQSIQKDEGIIAKPRYIIKKFNQISMLLLISQQTQNQLSTWTIANTSTLYSPIDTSLTKEYPLFWPIKVRFKILDGEGELMKLDPTTLSIYVSDMLFPLKWPPTYDAEEEIYEFWAVVYRNSPATKLPVRLDGVDIEVEWIAAIPLQVSRNTYILLLGILVFLILICISRILLSIDTRKNVRKLDGYLSLIPVKGNTLEVYKFTRRRFQRWTVPNGICEVKFIDIELQDDKPNMTDVFVSVYAIDGFPFWKRRQMFEGDEISIGVHGKLAISKEIPSEDATTIYRSGSQSPLDAIKSSANR